MTEISKNIQDNITKIKTMFDKWGDIVEKEFVLDREDCITEESIYVVYIDGLCDHELIENTVIKPVTWEWKHTHVDPENLWSRIVNVESQTADIT